MEILAFIGGVVCGLITIYIAAVVYFSKGLFR